MHDIPTPIMLNNSTPKPSAKKILMVHISPLGVNRYPHEIMCDVSMLCFGPYLLIFQLGGKRYS